MSVQGAGEYQGGEEALGGAVCDESGAWWTEECDGDAPTVICLMVCLVVFGWWCLVLVGIYPGVLVLNGYEETSLRIFFFFFCLQWLYNCTTHSGYSLWCMMAAFILFMLLVRR